MPATLTSNGCVENDRIEGEHYSLQRRGVSVVNNSKDNDQFTDDGECREVIEFFSFLQPSTLYIVCTATAAVLCAVLIFWCWISRRHQKMVKDSFFDDSLESKIIQSAPTSRTASPKLSKCKSCPDGLSIRTKIKDVLDTSMASAPPKPTPPEITKAGNSQGSIDAIFNRKAVGVAQVARDFCHRNSLLKDDELHYSETSCGCLWFSLVYDESIKLLYVKLIKAENLPGRNNNGHPRDPFVKIFLMPDEKMCQVSEIKKKTLSPVFNETYTFQITADDVRKHMVRFSMYDVDKRHVRHCLGHVIISLRNVDLTKGQIMWRKLEPMLQNATFIGELQFGLTYLPSSDKIKIKICNARNLKYLEEYLPLGVYVQAQLFYGHKCHRVKRTIVHQGEAEVTFNEFLTFRVCGKLLDTCNLKVSIMLMPYKLTAVNEIEYGRVVVGSFMFAHGDELAHWQEMLIKPELASTHWHNLISAVTSS